jgi:trehalose transport system substrate-binding protein
MEFLKSVVISLATTGMVGLLLFVLRKIGPERLKRWALILHQRGWPFLTIVFFVTALIVGILQRAGWRLVVVLAGLSVLTLVLVATLAKRGPSKMQKVLKGAWPLRWQILSGVLVLSILALLTMPGRFPPRERVVFVVDLDHHELMVFREILDYIEAQLGAEILVMNVDSSRHIACLHKMSATGEMKWDLVAVDNNILGLLEKRQLVEDLSQGTTYDELIPMELLCPVRPLIRKDSEGRYYFAPFRANVKIVFYNKNKFVDGLKPPKTWDDLLDVGRVFKESEDVGRVAIQGYPGKACAVTVYEFVKAAGGNPCTLDDKESKKAFKFMQELKEYLLTEHAEVTFNTANELLIDEDVYLVSNWPYTIKVVVEDFKMSEIKAYSGWSGPAGEFHVLGGDVLAIPKGARRPELAIKLIELLVSKPTQEELASRLRWPPVREDAYDNDKVPQKLAHYFEAVRKALYWAKPRPTKPQWLLIEDVLNKAYKDLIQDGNDVGALDKYSEKLAEIGKGVECYTVKKDDSLDAIATEYKINTADLAKLNGIKTHTLVYPDQKLLVPKRAESRTTE